MSAWLKAGLIGGAVLFVLNLIGQIPLVGCCTLLLTLVVYLVVGFMAAAYMPAPLDSGQAAGQGALAAALAAFIGGLINLIISLFWAAFGNLPQSITDLPPEVRYLLRDAGLEPEVITELTGFLTGFGGTLFSGLVCCLTGIIIAAILGAIGATIYAVTKSA